jgi:ketosteroid isomerase-like protein
MSMNERTPEMIVSDFLDALEARDFVQLRRYLSDTTFSYRSPVSRNDTADAFAINISRVGPILEGIERRMTFVKGNHVCSILNLRTTMETMKNVPLVQLATVSGGKIVALEAFFDASAYNRMFEFEQEGGGRQ